MDDDGYKYLHDVENKRETMLFMCHLSDQRRESIESVFQAYSPFWCVLVRVDNRDSIYQHVRFWVVLMIILQSITTLFSMLFISPFFLREVLFILCLPFPIAAGTTREHLGLALALQVPIFVVVSKIDLCPDMITSRTVNQLERLLTGCRKVPFKIKSDDDAVTAARTFNDSRWD